MATETTGTPGIQKQLTGAPSGPYDCVVRGGVDWPVTWATGRLIKPGDPMQIRHRMGIDDPYVGATIDQAKLGYESYKGNADNLGLDLGNLNVRDEGENSTIRDASGIRPALDAGHAIVLFVWYGKVNDIIPRASGDPDFRHGHCWTLFELRMHEGREQARVYDPLYDGVSGRPNGPLWVDLDDILTCAGAFRHGGDPGNDPIGQGNAMYGVAKRATYRDDTEPEPVPPEQTDLDRAHDALYDIRQLGTDIVWPRLVDMADAGLPPVDESAKEQHVRSGARHILD
jgi:hypothetical protein